jgi:hypothetical protein
MRFLLALVIFISILASNIYWAWTANWFIAVLVGAALAWLAERIIYAAVVARAHNAFRRDFLQHLPGKNLRS